MAGIHVAQFAMDGFYNLDSVLKHKDGIGPNNLTDFTLCLRFNLNYLQHKYLALLTYATYIDGDSLSVGFDVKPNSLHLCAWKYWTVLKQGVKCKKMDNFRVLNEWHHICWSFKTDDLDSDTKQITTAFYYNGKKVEKSK